MIITATLSKPVNKIEEILGKKYIKIKLTASESAEGLKYYAEFFTEKQVFHKYFSEEECEKFLDENAGITFKSCIKRTEDEEITILSNKKGKITTLLKKTAIKMQLKKSSANKTKNYLIEEGVPVPFMVLLGVMTDEGKIVASKYDKFKQINRFLEFIDDILPELISKKEEDDEIRIVDFGCGKSYLTFAVHYYLTQIKRLKCSIVGLDLKQEVINYCNQIAQKLKLKNLVFKMGDISKYDGKNSPDLIITLHACDTATDFALQYAVKMDCKAILSVPCCQHEINRQLSQSHCKNEVEKELLPLLKWGIIKEKFSSLVTDALRGEWLEQQGYEVQMLEFIDIEHTPKNILIRAVKKNKATDSKSAVALLDALNIKQNLWN